MPRPLNILAALSFLLCGGTVFLWLHTLHTRDRIDAYGSNRYSLESRAGRITLVCVQCLSETEKPVDLKWRYQLAHTPGEFDYGAYMFDRWTHFGFGYRRFEWFFSNTLDSTPSEIVYLTAVPHALPAILFALLPAYTIFNQTRNRRRTRTGRCIACGYDLRASNDRCPECGVAIPAFTAE